MPTIYQLKPASQKLLRPIVPWLAKIGVTPNQVTIFTTCLAIGCGGLILWNNSLVDRNQTSRLHSFPSGFLDRFPLCQCYPHSPIRATVGFAKQLNIYIGYR
jgi:hypothetical protein